MTEPSKYAIVKAGRITHVLGRPEPASGDGVFAGSGGQLEWWRRAHQGQGRVVVAILDAMAVGDSVDVADGCATKADGSQHPPVTHTISITRCDTVHEFPGCDKVAWSCSCQWAGSSGGHVYPSVAREQAASHLVAHGQPAHTVPDVPPMSQSAIDEWSAAVDATSSPDDVGG